MILLCRLGMRGSYLYQETIEKRSPCVTGVISCVVSARKATSIPGSPTMRNFAPVRRLVNTKEPPQCASGCGESDS